MQNEKSSSPKAGLRFDYLSDGPLGLLVARKRLAEEEPADNRVSVWIGVDHPDGDMPDQIPNKILIASTPGNHASVQ